MRVDFYQLSRDPAEAALPLLARATLKAGERMLVVSGDAAQLERIGQALWSLPESFLANGRVGEGGEERQPILLSDRPDPRNGARFLAITDGIWREGETPFARTFFLFDDHTVAGARDVWRLLRQREGAERHYWKQEGGRWIEAG
ncbi:DNA polymerase III subunit chi [Novosphingobium album (ex Liu et al. 2023)]|uniref:DNA polymerase III subunit chi n=1 Tax=Novosphingobium album (ex Liu et al. 2023) TaxID=3031130 RepID=A0ABT5WTN8_9SPHN|nr:DNA polymerase III subunit chi [Novosphingobium album (ex Liu et al. 2023)]MDE8653254.1 DNA polymerase III subunit chi [Novosphingobium album (ex Liu et al. 2023)]